MKRIEMQKDDIYGLLHSACNGQGQANHFARTNIVPCSTASGIDKYYIVHTHYL